MLYSRRSAKSVACSKLKVVGVREFFFFPIFVAAFTSADEFHSVTNTRRPAALNHLASNASCVVFPDPSMPSTTNSFPGYSCGVLRLFSIRGSTRADANRFSQRAFQRRYLTLGGPELQLGVARCSKFDEIFFTAIVQLHARDGLRMATIERLGEPQNRSQGAHRAAPLRTKRAEIGVRFLWRRLAVIPRHQRDDLRFRRLETPQMTVLDEVVRVLVMPRIADVRADVMQQRRELEPLALAIGEAMDAARLIEDRQRESRDLTRVFGPIAAALGQLDDTAPPHVRVLAGLRDMFSVALDVIENEPFAQREITEGDFSRLEFLQDGIEQHSAGDDQIGPPRI